MRAAPTALLTLALAACGNFSNLDLQFAAALPDDTLQFQAPDDEGQALTAGDVATDESPLLDRAGLRRVRVAQEHARLLNRFVKDTAARLREITAHAPTARDEGRRTWGPFELATKRFARLVMVRDDAFSCPGAAPGAPAFAWRFETSDRKAGTFTALLSGHTRGGDFERSCGDLAFDTAEWKRNGGAPEQDDPARVTVAWERDEARSLLTATAEPGVDRRGRLVVGARTEFERRADGSRRFLFARSEAVFGRVASDLELVETQYQWLGRGVPGRVDVRVTGGETPEGPGVATACWSGAGAPDVYVNPFDRQNERGDPNTCRFTTGLP